MSGAFSMALGIKTTTQQRAAQGCAVLVNLLVLWCVCVSWLAGHAELTTLGFGPPIVPYTITSFAMVGIILLAVSLHNDAIPDVFSEGMKFGVSLVLFSAATMAGLDLIFSTRSVLSMNLPGILFQRAIPSPLTVVCFILVSITGFLSYLNVWRLVLSSAVIGVGTSAVLGTLTEIPLLYYSIPGWSEGMAWITGVMFILSGSCYILMTSHWKRG